MFYYYLSTLITYNGILVAAAVLPAVFLMVRAYRSDRLEREPTPMLWDLGKAGVFASLIALVEERVLSLLLNAAVPQSAALYDVVLYFGIVAFAEESSKYLMLRRHSWHSPAFNCQYDGVVYAVFVSLGFALWENVSYVLSYGLGTALLRALTAIPGHACFGVFMGVFYGVAKKLDRRGEARASSTFRTLSVVIPALLHGAYDYIASTTSGTWFFVVFIAILFAASYLIVGRMSKIDRYI